MLIDYLPPCVRCRVLFPDEWERKIHTHTVEFSDISKSFHFHEVVCLFVDNETDGKMKEREKWIKKKVVVILEDSQSS